MKNIIFTTAIALLLMLAHTFLIAQKSEKFNISKSQFTIDVNGKTNIMPAKIWLNKENSGVNNFTSKMRFYHKTTVKKFSYLSEKHKFNFSSGDLKGKNNILPPRAEAKRFAGKKNLILPENNTKYNNWKFKH